MERRLVWHIVLFVLYLITIGLLFTGVILDKALSEHDVLKMWIERSYLFVGISSFFFTFALPAALLEMQRARYDAETDRRRRAVGIQPDDTKASS
jgi:D-alanyl-lipoteichoic acid acyltransferase DltB (MBOAT superfamily)